MGREIAELQKKGYAPTVEEGVMGEVVVGAAIIDADGRPAAAIHIAGSLGEWKAAEFDERLGRLLAETAHRLSKSFERCGLSDGSTRPYLVS
jgi:DNA-binding IclR family transcriptional regulator